MAVVARLARVDKVSAVFSDNTGTPLTHTPTAVVKGSIKPSLFRKQTKNHVMTQSGSGNVHYDTITALEGPDTFSLEFYLNDPVNTSDVTVYQIVKQLYQDSGAFAAPLASWTNTNPTPGGTGLMLDLKLTFTNLQGASTNAVMAAAVAVTEVSELSEDSGAYKYTVTFAKAEEWTVT
jgi:hypothetical protein